METKDNTAAKQIGMRLRLMRTEQRLSCAEICERAGIKPPTLTAIEGGYYNTGIRQITDVAKALGAHIEVVKD